MSERARHDADPGWRMAPSLIAALGGEAVRVGTQNRAKCEAVRIAVEMLRPAAAPDSAGALRIVPVAVESGVAEQPVGFEEIARGARQRAEAAFHSGPASLAFGIEDGLVELGEVARSSGLGAESVFNIGCAWVTDGERTGSGFSSAFAYPPGCLEPANRDQVPIGDLLDRIWRDRRDPDATGPSGANEGNIGKLTGGCLTRSDYGSHAVICALVRFLQIDLYD